MLYNFHAPLKSASVHERLIIKKRKKFISISLLIFSLTLYIPYGESADIKSSIGQNQISLALSIKRTLKEHPSLQVFTFREKALQGQLQTQGLTPAFELGFEVENFAGTGDFSALNQAQYTLSLSSVLEIGDKKESRLGVVKSRTSQLQAMRKIQALNLLSEVTRRYIDVIAAQERLALAREAETLAIETLSEVEKRANAGISPDAEINRALAAMGNAKLVVSSEDKQFEYSKIALAMMWNEPSPSFTAVNGNLYTFTEDVPFEQLFAKVVQNPEILMYASEERIKDAEIRLARSESSLNLKWSVGIRQMQDTNETALTAGFSMPLFSSSRNEGAVISAQASRDEIIVKRKATLLALRNQLYRAYANRKQAIFTAENLEKSIIPTLTKALNETQVAYQRGRYSYLDYLTARQELIYARRSMIESASSALRFGTEIEQLIAEPLPAAQFKSMSPTNKKL